MTELRSQVRIRQELGRGMRTLRSGRGMGLKLFRGRLRRAGVQLTEARALGVESGEHSLIWAEFVKVLRVLECSLSGFGRVLHGELPECEERPPLSWAHTGLFGLALSALRERAELAPSSLAAHLAKAGITVEKIARWESGKLPITVVRVLIVLDALGFDLAELERELERQSAELGLRSGRGRSFRQSWGDLLIEPGG